MPYFRRDAPEPLIEPVVSVPHHEETHLNLFHDPAPHQCSEESKHPLIFVLRRVVLQIQTCYGEYHLNEDFFVIQLIPAIMFENFVQARDTSICLSEYDPSALNKETSLENSVMIQPTR